jgi:hypothetical protein|tara:strand:+ start:8156 stop:8473 length:318 start_codon:yes stop_codon:yes gene_type:complete
MNTKKMSKIRRKAVTFLVIWIKGLLNKKEQANVTIKNVFSLLPNQTHYYNGDSLKLQPWSLKWIVKKLKKNPLLTYDELNAMLQPTERDIRRYKMIKEGPIKNDT